jgi:protein TonB
VDRLAGLLLVLVLHAAVLGSLWKHRLIPFPREAATLFVNFIAPPAPPRLEPPKRLPTPPLPRPAEQPRQLVAQAPVVAPADYAVASPPPKPAVMAPVMAVPAGPVTLSSELSVVCPERTAPPYPAWSRRLGETGTVVLRVELGETGHVEVARVSTSSGYPRLDDAALAVVRTWRCAPAIRNGQPVRAVALQPFAFVMQGD